jgi:hypothetical protein
LSHLVADAGQRADPADAMILDADFPLGAPAAFAGGKEIGELGGHGVEDVGCGVGGGVAHIPIKPQPSLGVNPPRLWRVSHYSGLGRMASVFAISSIASSWRPAWAWRRAAIACRPARRAVLRSSAVSASQMVARISSSAIHGSSPSSYGQWLLMVPLNHSRAGESIPARCGVCHISRPTRLRHRMGRSPRRGTRC